MPDVSLTDFSSQAADIQRRRKLADLLQQQADAPIQIQSYQGIQAPISPFSVLAKGLRAYNARKNQETADEEERQLSAADRANAQLLMKQLQGPNTLAERPIAPQSVPIPGVGGAPGAQVQLPGSNGPGGLTNLPPSPQQQAALLMGADGGPKTQGIVQAMLPRMFAEQDYQRGRADKVADRTAENDMSRSNTLWQNSLPMSTAATQQGVAQTQQAKELAKYKNDLPADADARLQYNLGMAKLKAAGDTGMTEDGTFTPRVQSFGQNVISGNMTFQSVPAKDKGAVSMYLTQQAAHSPLAGTRLTLESERITKPYRDMPGYSLAASAQPYIDRIDAALNHPGSVGDQDALDALTKLNTGGNAVTDAQIKIITDGKSLKDWFGVAAGRLAKKGGILSDDQRQQIAAISNEIAKNYNKSYQPIREQATEQLRAAKIPEQFWTIPDLNKLSARRAAMENKPPADADANAEALAWANANPKDPRAAAIKQRLGAK